MTDKLFLKDSYIKEASAVLVAKTDAGLVFDRTVFYPAGGGQPCDTGTVFFGKGQANISSVSKSNDDVIHILEAETPIEVGENVKLSIDWDRRYSHMRHHTAIHIMDAVVQKKGGEFGLITGSQIYQDRARVDFDFPEFSREIAEKIVQEANAVIAEDHRIIVRDLTQAEALSIPDLARTGPGRELLKQLEIIRVVDIEGVDAQADGGTHVKSTKEVGKIVMSKIESKGRRNKRLSFALSAP